VQTEPEAGREALDLRGAGTAVADREGMAAWRQLFSESSQRVESGSNEVNRSSGRRSRGSEFWRIGREAEMEEDPPDDILVADERQQAARSAAVGADQGVVQEHALEQLGPE
jgi:hypothetical protein